jgi:hypothetical protein
MLGKYSVTAPEVRIATVPVANTFEITNASQAAITASQAQQQTALVQTFGSDGGNIPQAMPVQFTQSNPHVAASSGTTSS